MKPHPTKTSCLRAVACLVISILGSASISLAQDDDYGLPVNSPQWVSMGGFPGTSGLVYCTTIGPDGKLYVGGAFATAGTARSFGVARWNGSSWESISPAFAGGGGYFVRSMAFGPEGNLYVGGSFHNFAGVGAMRIAMWDGQDWHAMDSGLGYYGSHHEHMVATITVCPDGVVYAGGCFNIAGNQTVNNVARWDGQQWQPLAQGLVNWSGGSMVETLIFDDDGALYAGGSFTNAGAVIGSTQVRGVAKWDGTLWQPLGSGVNTAGALMFDTNGDLIVGGEFKFAGGIEVNNIARWDGESWSAFGPAGANAGFMVSTSQPIRALALDADGHVLASSRVVFTNPGVRFELMRWDGTAWQTALPVSPNSPIRSVTVMPSGNIVIGGDFISFSSESETFHANYIAEWDGQFMHRFGTGPNGAVSTVKFDSNGHMIVAGSFQTIGGIEASRIARYDGKRWWPYGDGLNGGVSSITLGPDGAIYAGGNFTKAGDEESNMVAMWNGGQWVSLAGGIQSMQNSTLSSVLLAPDGDLYVGGRFAQSVSGVLMSGIGRWSNGHWHDLDGGCKSQYNLPSNGLFRDIILDPAGNLVVAGSFNRIGSDGVYRPHVARWDGQSWSAIGPTALGQIPHITYGLNVVRYSPSGVLHAGYSNDTSTSDDVNAMLRLQNNSWAQIGNGFAGRSYAMVFDNFGKIFVGGRLNRTGPSPRHNLKGVTFWDGARWSSLGKDGLGMSVGGTFSESVVVLTMVSDGRGNLVIGGQFSGSANGVVSPFLIRTSMEGYGYWTGLGSLPVDRLAPSDRNGPMNLPNLMAYALGVDPMQATTESLPRIVMDGEDDDDIFIPFSATTESTGLAEATDTPATIKFQYQRNPSARKIMTRVEVSEDLAIWQPAEIIASRVVDVHADWERLQVEIPKKEHSMFLRLVTEFDDDF